MIFMSYNELLDKVYENLPEKATTSERFEPPSFNSFIEGKQTMINNFKEVADVLRRDPQHLLRFLTKEFASPSHFDGKRATLQGKFKNDQLNKRLDVYIEEFVMCKECDRPDTELINIEGIKHKVCEACGARSPVKSV